MKHTLTKAAAIGAIVAGAMFAVPTAASAYTPPPTGSVSTSTVAAGGTFTFFTDNAPFLPGETVTVTLTGENASGASLAFVKFAVETQNLGTTTANADGDVSTQITLPANATGTYTITATSASNPVGVSSTVTVSGSATDPGADDELATTGADSEALLTLWIGGGALLLVGGGIAVASAVRRNRQKAEATI
ncbi:hypothetical protein MZK47_09835 [Microbacterium aerolatum]|uniref:hypothetical protein n=1 Tax=Microbacterium aerolatum TaxID=153731 RepID=UPI00200092DB|nr:hypothetical protein [Microbacterium aerolatum]MCK3769967.1 hypothetical protein [Microbacterium aerolatum]